LSSRRKYLTALSYLAPLGAAGMSLALGAAPAAANATPTGREPSLAGREGMSERLAAVRDAISTLDGDRAGLGQLGLRRRLAELEQLAQLAELGELVPQLVS
jgi:hypothetical protein